MRDHVPMPAFLSLTMKDNYQFWSKVKRLEKCWHWTGCTKSATNFHGQLDSPYGFFGCQGYSYLAHRFSYFLSNRKDPGELIVRHLCNNTICVRPDHLELGSHGDNKNDCYISGRHQIGSNVPGAVLTDVDIPMIMQRYLEGELVNQIAKSLGVSYNTIKRVVTGETYRNIAR